MKGGWMLFSGKGHRKFFLQLQVSNWMCSSLSIPLVDLTSNFVTNSLKMHFTSHLHYCKVTLTLNSVPTYAHDLQCPDRDSSCDLWYNGTEPTLHTIPTKYGSRC
jgi:hypothetical protein